MKEIYILCNCCRNNQQNPACNARYSGTWKFNDCEWKQNVIYIYSIVNIHIVDLIMKAFNLVEGYRRFEEYTA
jgi:hypothetical protein